METIRPSSDLRNHYAEISRQCRDTQAPVFITLNGREDTVLMSMMEYKRMREDMKLYEMLAESEDDVRNGRVEPIEGTFEEIRAYLQEMDLNEL
ncbi:MAG: type II toxin-antitoxin system Phd/YefM family antitoxin [Oscillospiraceae bacterium]|nr:type II toxin-antitoxin system Phd/YefM family antitoxin [Oscillospiraceae bacterium]